ncbi:MAG: calcium/sodium antiporter [Candidatus Hydrogenedentes bacterium]|nr:calcium/sodium antiporter [Candidatus Hydrogenedentota bacterium]
MGAVGAGCGTIGSNVNARYLPRAMLSGTMLVLYLIGLAVAVAILVKSADLFTDAAVEVARRLRIPELIVGATIVSLATTLPEFAVSFTSAVRGQVDFAVGNAVGSTICNVGMILGICAMLSPMGIERKGFLSSGLGLIMLGAIFSVLGYAFPEGSRWMGVVMMACLVAYLAYTVRSALQGRTEPADPATPNMSGLRVGVLFALGAAGIVGGGTLMVECGARIARLMGVPELIIGLTFLAIGTSTPEFVVSISGIIKKQRALSIGNIIGANILNLAWIIGSCSLVTNLPVRQQTRVLDIPVMLLLSLLLVVFGLTGQRLSRREGAILFAIYVAYLAVMFTVFRGAAA